MRTESTINSGRINNPDNSVSSNPRLENRGRSFLESISSQSGDMRASVPRQILIGLLLLLALLAFETFNFDTTRYALDDFLGETSFLNIRWATILAVAFCAIDFAGLAYLFGTDQTKGQSREVWYLMGAWLLGATMNALMTWWAVSITLLSHELGNEVMSRADLLQIVPIFVAVLVWLTRILFIGAFSVAGNHFFGLTSEAQNAGRRPLNTPIKKDAPRPVGYTPMPKAAMAAQGRRRR
jgi:hypothetical protein